MLGIRMSRRVRILTPVCFLMVSLLLASGSPGLVSAQEETPGTATPDLLLFTDFPSQVIGVGETVTLKLSLRSGIGAQIVNLAVQGLPEGWTTDFRGGGRSVRSVYIKPDADASVELRVEPPNEVQPGAYRFTVAARGDQAESELPVELIVQEKVPPRLAFQVELPTLRGKPTTVFRYNVTLKNEGVRT